MTITDITRPGSRSGSGPDPLLAVTVTDDEAAPAPLRFRARWSRLTPSEAVAIQAGAAGAVAATRVLPSAAWWLPPALLATTVVVLWWLRNRSRAPVVRSTREGFPRWRNPVDLLVPGFETGQIASRGGDTIGLACDGADWVFALRVPSPGRGDQAWIMELVRILDRAVPDPVGVRLVVPLRTLPDELLRTPTDRWPKAAERISASGQDNAALIVLTIPQRGPFGHLSIGSAAWLRNEIRQAMSPLRYELRTAGFEPVLLNELQLRTEIQRLSFGPEVAAVDDDEPGHAPGGSTWRYVDRDHVVFEVLTAEEEAMVDFLDRAGTLRPPGLVASFGRARCGVTAELPPRGLVHTALIAVTHLSGPAAERAAERVTDALVASGVGFRRLDRFHRAGFGALLPVGRGLPRRTRFLARHRSGTADGPALRRRRSRVR